MRSAYELSDGGAGLATPREPAPQKAWDFNTEKLERLIERGEQARALLRDLNDRRASVISRRGRAQFELARQRDQFSGRTNSTTEAQYEAAERALSLLDRELETAQETLLPTIDLAQRCRSWAEAQGWPGTPKAADAPPAVTGTQASEAAAAASRRVLFPQGHDAGGME